METCKYCGRPSQGYCCEFCWDEFEDDGLYGEEDGDDDGDGDD